MGADADADVGADVGADADADADADAGVDGDGGADADAGVDGDVVKAGRQPCREASAAHARQALAALCCAGLRG